MDLLVGCAAIEIKVAGFFGDEGERYLRYRKMIEAKGWKYFYLTLDETHLPYRAVAHRAFGEQLTFVLSEIGEWPRFVARVVHSLGRPRL